MKSFVFIGRGGQGVKTAAVILAKSGAEQGLQIQSFPEYGPERMGAPVKAYTKIDNKEIRSFSPILEPDYVLLIDDTLISIALQVLKKNTILIVNTDCGPEKYSKKYNIKNKVVTIDATKISMDNINANKPNIPIIGALLKFEKILNIEGLTKTIEKHFSKKGKEDFVKGNINAIKQAYERCNF